MRHPTVSAKLQQDCPVIGSLTINFLQEGEVRPGRILGRKPYLTVITGKVDHLQGICKYLFPGLPEFETHVEFGCGDKDAHHIDIAVDCRLNISFACPGETADPGIETQIRDSLHALLLGRRNGRKSSLDDFDADPVQHCCNLYLLLAGERNARRLLPVY